MVKLHLGCGNIRLDGFINIDIRQTPATDRLMDITNLAEFGDNSVDMICSSHCLEHFSFRIVPDILREWNRVLKKGGELVVRVPDFDILVNTYLKSHLHRSQALDFTPEGSYPVRVLKTIRHLIFKKDEKEGVLARIKRFIMFYFRVERRTLTLGGQNYAENQHKAFFNEKFLRDLLDKAGFDGIKRIDSDYFPPDKHHATLGFSCIKR
jgi:predicted SAM-dependent methyltransferase